MNALFLGDRVRFGGYEGVVVEIWYRNPTEVTIEFEDGSRGIMFASAVRKLEAA